MSSAIKLNQLNFELMIDMITHIVGKLSMGEKDESKRNGRSLTPNSKQKM